MGTEEHNRIGVVLLNLGGPERLEDVRPFLYNLFSDRQIIRLGPAFMQKPLAWLIAKQRAPKSCGYYQQIGGGSPLNTITANQCQALEGVLNKLGKYSVHMAMRYWHPFAGRVLAAITKAGIKKVVTLTLYPHYSIATTGSSLTDFHNKAQTMKTDLDIADINAWPTQPNYIDCLAQRITKNITLCPQKTEVVYSAHSLPKKFIDEGDPYIDHLKKTILAIEKKTEKQGHLCFQSRSGPVEWLEPSTPELLDRLAASGCKNVVMVPISFVSDHVETLCEIDIQYKKQLRQHGVSCSRTESLNTDPHFIRGLADLVVSTCHAKGWI